MRMLRDVEKVEIVDCPTCRRPGHAVRRSREILTEVDEDVASWSSYRILSEEMTWAPVGSIRAVAFPGSEVWASVSEGVALANAEGRPVAFAFNGSPVVCRPGDDPEEVARAWWRLLRAKEG